MSQNHNDIITPFEQNKNHSASFEQIVSFYESLNSRTHIQVNDFGSTDIGEPLQEVIVDKDGLTDPKAIREAGKSIIFINNGIHPGEPCGIDASMMLLRDLESNTSLWNALDKVSLVVVPVYNIGGCINRNSHTRANQVGPEAYGFRGNAKNYDLNRDFIKCDSKNAQSFAQLFQKWSPDIMIDNHTSNGADYQYVMTLITTQEDKLSPSLGSFVKSTMKPYLFEAMKNDRYEMIPYVDVRTTPDDGIMGFLDYGRYSSGFAALHHTISFMPETHMLKPFEDRVLSTYDFMKHTIQFASEFKEELLESRKQAVEEYKTMNTIPVNWKNDKNQSSELLFKGYEAEYSISNVTGMKRLSYNREKPYEKVIPYYNTFEVSDSISAPKAYIIPQAYSDVIERLEWNGVEMEEIKEDTVIEVEMYYIEDFETVDYPYEGHYLHYNVNLNKVKRNQSYRKGDVLVFANQNANRFLFETLEPQAPDSYFNWNFMDAVLQQKEYFSSYVFEDLVEEYLDMDSELEKEFLEKKENDAEFASNSRAQLDFIYRHSKHYEYTHKLYPIARLVDSE